MQQKVVFCVAAALAALAMACGGSGSNPTSPSSSGVSPTADGSNAAADGSTLKVSAPTLSSPIGGVRLEDSRATLVFRAAIPTYVQSLNVIYHAQVMNAAGAVVQDLIVGGLSLTTTVDFDVDAIYRWRVRAEIQDTFGPWSTTETFRSLDKQLGYARGSELYDPLTEGVTIGRINGPVTFIPGVGARMDSRASYIEYQMPETLEEGEFSALVTGLSVVSNTEDPKDRVITMRQGDAAINDNVYRMSVDKRGNGAVAWRFLTGGGPYIETIGAERQVVAFHEALTYFVKAEWRFNFFHVEFREGGVTGRTVYDYGKPYTSFYGPHPHMVFAGSPYKSGDRGEISTVEDMTIRQIWVSEKPRPGFANK